VARIAGTREAGREKEIDGTTAEREKSLSQGVLASIGRKIAGKLVSRISL